MLKEEAERFGLDGVVCGHIHKADIKQTPTAYFNCGDWVESCTLVVEHFDGRMEIVDGMTAPASSRESAASVEGLLAASS